MDDEQREAERDRLAEIVNSIDGAAPAFMDYIRSERDRLVAELVSAENPEYRGAIKFANGIITLRDRTVAELAQIQAALSGEVPDAED